MSQQRADQLVEAGLWLKLSGDVDGARRLFEQALRMDPQNVKAKQLLDASPGGAAPPPPAAGPPGTVAPPSNAPQPSSAPSLLEQDWAMATGILAERLRGQTPPPVPLTPGASVPDVPWAPRAVPDSSKPWAAEPHAQLGSGPTPSTLIWGQVERAPAPSPSPEQPSGTIIWGQVEPAPPAALPVNPLESAWDDQAEPTENITPAAGLGRAMDLVATPIPVFTPLPNASRRNVQDEVRSLLKGARDLLDLDDHTGAVDLIMKAQELAPADPDVARMRERSEQILQTMFESKLGAMEKHPRVVLKDDEIIWLNLDHRAGFVLAQIDGTVSFEDLFAVSGMSRLDTARILAQLMDQGIIKT